MPANGAYAVNTDSIVIVFDKKVPIETNSLEDLDFFFIEPEDSVQITSAKLSSDGLKATIYLNLKENTDYIAGIQGIRDDNGETADYLYIFQFTTAPTLGEFTVEGNLVSDDLPALKAELDSQIVVAVLSTNKLFLNDDTGDDMTFSRVAIVDVNNLTYSIPWVREGVYYPISMAVGNNSDDILPSFFLYDLDNNLAQPDSIVVNSTTAPTGTLSNINLKQLKFAPITYFESLANSASIATQLGENAIFLSSRTESYISNYYGKRSKANPLRAKAKNNDAEAPFILSGKSIYWNHFYYDTTTTNVYQLDIGPFWADISDTLLHEDVELPEGISLSTLKPIPANALNSDSIATIINANGGAEFQALYANDPFSWAEVTIELAHKYWLYQENPTPTAPVLWTAEFNADSYDPETDTYHSDSLHIYMDAITGEILQTSRPTSIEERRDSPKEFMLGQNYPNPFNPTTNIPFTLGSASHINLTIYNMLGQKVATIANQVYNSGSHSLKWDATQFSSGVYLYRLTANGVSQTRKLMLIK